MILLKENQIAQNGLILQKKNKNKNKTNTHILGSMLSELTI